MAQQTRKSRPVGWLLAALLLCYVGGVLSAFASSVAILGVAIPLALPFLQQGEVSAVGMVAALAVARHIPEGSRGGKGGTTKNKH